ncbi:T9SS type A sorting domain-containing protein [Niastella caeni]|uniref:T9SS type A sorting domain-containing protein n=1 Tax=Niastella caeni TaxID=2569763 RepID=A0A4S8HG51_9BACT|nr:pectinesterase family protein [Niastella caeni]THU34130.1 T9SS type A sorting domain-containing protein [Niastella caeni]
MRNFTRYAIVLMSFLFLAIRAQAQQPAFPGAEGAGMYTTGGRGTAAVPTTVFEVTNLNDDNNPGSLRYALTTTATYRTVVFRVSGTIHLNSKLSIKANTTIAGQTAPGDGICIADHPVSIGGDNVIVRHIRFRLGDRNQNKGMVDGSGGDDAFGGTSVNNVIIDHCSVSWSADEALTIYRGDNLTIQWCFITEPLNYSYHFEAGDTDFEQHGYNGIQGGKRATIHHNLYADARNRNPRFAGIETYSPNTVGVENVDFRNNVIYNWGINTVYGGEGGNYNVVNNYYKWGPNTGSGVKYRICNPSYSTSPSIPFGKWYVNGNYVDGSTQNTNNNWSGVVMQTNANDTVLSKVTTQFDLGYSVTTEAAIDAFESVLQGAGATLPRRDTLDQRIANDVRNRTGRIIDVQGGYPHGTAYNLTVNAWPTLNSTTAPVDTDHDGMPDAWETSHSLNPNDASDRNIYDGSGYTMLEKYLNGVENTDPSVAVGGSLRYFSQSSASPSAVQTYTVAGYNLTGNVSITPPASYELSLDGTTWYGSTSTIVLTPTSGTLSSTNIMVRLNATAQGTYAGNITHTSAGAATTNVAVTGIYTTIANGLGFNADMDGGFERQTEGSYTTVATHTSTTQWEVSAAWNISSTDARTGSKFLHYNQASSSNKYIFSPVCTTTPLAASTPYVVQFWYRAPSALSSTTVLSAWATIVGSVGGSNSASSSATASLSAATVPGTWYFFSGTLTTPAGTPTSTYAGLKTSNPQSPYFDIDDFVLYAGSAADAIAPDAPTAPTASGNANNNTINVSWTAPASGIDGGGYVVVRSTSATAPVPNANGVYIAGNTMGTGNQVVYLGTNTSFTDTDPVISATTRYYYYVFTADKAYNYCAAPVSANVMIDEVTTPTPTISATGTLVAFTQTVGAPSSTQTITVSGTDLTGNITITVPVNFQLSTDNGATWSSSSLTLTPASGTVSATTVLVRLNATGTGAYSGNVVVSSANATTINIAVSGNTVPAGSQPPTGTRAVVAKDGSGDYTSIQAAINAAPTGQTAPYKIYIRKGKYVEAVIIPSNKPFIQLVGESLAETIISYDNYSGKANPAGGTYGTSTSGTLIINAADVMLMNLSIENATGYGVNANALVPAPGDGPQAVAVYTTSDRVVFYNCRMNGGQDTYYGGNNPATRCYLKNCYIDGNTDFMFGSSTIIFDTCIIYPRTRLDNATGGYVTAVNTKAASLYGYVFRDCKITKNRGFTLYSLGRPWQNDAGTADAAKSRNKTVFLNTTMGSTVRPDGWSVWDAGTNTSYITYGEYNSRNYNGTAVNVSSRLSWTKQLTAAEAVKYYNNDTVFVNANTPAMATWNPYATYSELSTAFKPELAVSNLIAKKGVSTTTITWNMSWPMTGITCDLYRSNDKTNFSKIYSEVSTEDSANNFSFTENIPPPGQTYYYIVRASKSGYASTTSDTSSVTSTPTITVSGTLGSFLQGLGTPSATQTFVVSGANLTAGITITPPASYEVSVDNTTWYNSTTPLTVAQSNGMVANTYITVRLNGTAVGTYNSNIVNASTGATSVNVAVSGTIQADPLSAGGMLLEQWPLTTNNLDSTGVRAVGVIGTTPVLNNLVVSNGTTDPTVPAYSALHGQAYAATADGSWTTASGGPGSTLSRRHYEQFTVVAAATHNLRVDSIILNTAFHNTSSTTKVAVLYSKTGFRTDSTEIKVVSKNGTPLTAGTNGTFTNAFDVSNQVAGNPDVFAMLVNGSAGVTVRAGDTLTFRVYHCTGSTSTNRYVKLKNVMVKGISELKPNTGDYRTIKSGEWSDGATWLKYNGTDWVAAGTDYPAYDNGVNKATIQKNHTVSYTQTFSKGFGYIQKTVIAEGGQLIVGAGKTLSVAGINGSSVVLQVDGTLTNLGTIGTNGKVVYQINGKMVNSGSLSFNTGDSVAVGATGIYQHDMNGGLPARISFASGSTLLVTGIKTAQTNLFTSATTVSNMIWNCTAQQNYFALRNTLAAVTGNLTVQSTGSTYVALSQGTAALRISGNYLQTGGSVYFNESATGVIDSLVVGGDFTISGGTFTTNMKNSDPLYIKLNGSNKTFSHVGTLANTHVLVNGKYNLGSNLALPTANFGLVVNGTLNTGTYVVSGAGNTTVADTATVSFGSATGIDGNFANTGIKQYSVIANYTFNGTAAQTTGATMPAGAHTLTINNSANVTLSGALTADVVSLTNGKLLLGNNTLADSAITGNVPANYIVLNGTGRLKQKVSAATGNVLFPIGTSLSSYTPATLSNTGTADNFSVSVKDNLDYTIYDTTKIVRKQWTITPDNASGAANVGLAFGWVAANQGSKFDPASANILQYRNNAWANATATTTGSGTAAAPYIATAGGFTQFGAFVVGHAIPAPTIVTTGVFNAFSQTVGKSTDAQTFTLQVKDMMGTATITPPAGYEISVDTGKTWYTEAAVPALSGNASGVLSRSVMVRMNASATGIYEGNIVVQTLNAADANVSVIGTAYSEYALHPNPANSFINVFHTKLYTQANIRIYNMNGHLMGTYRSKRATNYTAINISALPNGMYFVEVERLHDRVLLRFIKQ